MPYIKNYDKTKFGHMLAVLKAEAVPSNAGELNYLITVILHNYLLVNGGKYQQHNDILGVLSASSQEFYRRSTAIYEDLKAKENGDVTTE